MLWVLFQVLLLSSVISILKYVIFHPPKTKLQLVENWSDKDIRLREKMVYIGIGYKSAHHQTDKWWNDTKDKVTLIYILPIWIKSLALT